MAPVGIRTSSPGAGSIEARALGSRGAGLDRRQDLDEGVARDGDPHLAGPVLGATDATERQVVQELVGHHDARAVGGHAIEHGHTVDRAQDRSSPGTAFDRDRPDGQIVEVFEHLAEQRAVARAGLDQLARVGSPEPIPDLANGVGHEGPEHRVDMGTGDEVAA